MIKAQATFKDEKAADCITEITGNSELIALEYASITQVLLHTDGGQTILDRAMDLMKKEIDVYEEKRS